MRGRRTWLLVSLCAALLLTIAVSGGVGQSQVTPPPGVSPAGGRMTTTTAGDAGDAGAGTAGDVANDSGRFSVTTTTIVSDRAIVVVDARTQRLLVYSMDNSSRPPLLKLMAVRNISHDVKLEHWNNAHPYPDEIRQSLSDGSTGR